MSLEHRLSVPSPRPTANRMVGSGTGKDRWMHMGGNSTRARVDPCMREVHQKHLHHRDRRECEILNL